MEKQPLIIGVSGVRGVVGKGLTEAIVSRLVRSWAEAFPGPVVLGRDSRPSGHQLAKAAQRALLETRHPIYELGIVPTPTVGRAVRCLGASAGVQITGSHNPPEWNGLKMFTAQGRVLPPSEAGPVLERFRIVLRELGQNQESGGTVPLGTEQSVRVGSIVECGESVVREHVEAVLACVNSEAIRRRRFRVLVDGNGGAGGPMALRLLEALACQVVPVNCQPDGTFRHAPEPTPQSLHEVAPLVAQCGCEVGLALDTDADRLVLMDETGRCLSEEMTLALATEARLRQQPGPVVTNFSTSLMVEELCQRRGHVCYRTPVGEAHVVDGMLKNHAVIGGEGNGGVIDPRIGLVRDPFIGMALVLELLAILNKPLSALAASLPNYVIRKEKVHLEQLVWSEARRRLLDVLKEPRPDERDGLYFRWPDRWLHVRPSNTEPIVRIVAEAPSEQETNTLIELARSALLT